MNRAIAGKFFRTVRSEYGSENDRRIVGPVGGRLSVRHAMIRESRSDTFAEKTAGILRVPAVNDKAFFSA